MRCRTAMGALRTSGAGGGGVARATIRMVPRSRMRTLAATRSRGMPRSRRFWLASDAMNAHITAGVSTSGSMPACW